MKKNGINKKAIRQLSTFVESLYRGIGLIDKSDCGVEAREVIAIIERPEILNLDEFDFDRSIKRHLDPEIVALAIRIDESDINNFEQTWWNQHEGWEEISVSEERNMENKAFWEDCRWAMDDGFEDGPDEDEIETDDEVDNEDENLVFSHTEMILELRKLLVETATDVTTIIKQITT